MTKRVRLARRQILAAAMAAAIAGVAQLAGPAVAQAITGPDTVAVSQVQNLINTVRGATTTYAGLWINDKTGTVYVSTTKSGITASTVAALEPRPAAKAATMKIDVVQARYDFAQLARIDGRVIKDAGLRQAAKASHATLSEWYPDLVTDKVVIGFTKVTAAEKAAVRAEYGATARVITVPIAIADIGKVRPGTVHPSTSRDADSAPWYGGDEIDFDGDWSCTSGYDFSTNLMSTAGHCGYDPETFYNDGTFYGRTYAVQWGNGRIDMQLMNGSTDLPYIWAGPGGVYPEPVSGSGGVAQGGHYCTGGYMTVQSCSAVVEAIDVCSVESDDFTGTNVNVCDLDKAYSSNGSVISQPGDSGGPVYTASSVDDPYAVGTISAGEDNDTVTFWSDMYMEKEIFHTSPEIG
jgi:hypothetical protein